MAGRKDQRDTPITFRLAREWVPVLVALVGGIIAGTVAWASLTNDARALDKRVTVVEQRLAEDDAWKRGVDRKLTTILCVVVKDDRECLRQ